MARIEKAKAVKTSAAGHSKRSTKHKLRRLILHTTRRRRLSLRESCRFQTVRHSPPITQTPSQGQKPQRKVSAHKWQTADARLSTPQACSSEVTHNLF